MLQTYAIGELKILKINRTFLLEQVTEMQDLRWRGRRGTTDLTTGVLDFYWVCVCVCVWEREKGGGSGGAG